MRILQGFLIFMGALAVLAIIALILGYVFALLTPDIRSSMRPVVLSSEAVDSFNKKITALKKETILADTTNTQRNVELVVTEEEVNSIIVMALAEGSFPAKDMLVNFNDGYLLTYTAWNFPGLPVKTGLIGSIDVEGGKPKFIIRDFSLGKLPVPDSVDAGIQNLVNIMVKLNVPLEDMKLDLKEVTIKEGQIKVTGATRPAK